MGWGGVGWGRLGVGQVLYWRKHWSRYFPGNLDETPMSASDGLSGVLLVGYLVFRRGGQGVACLAFLQRLFRKWLPHRKV